MTEILSEGGSAARWAGALCSPTWRFGGRSVLEIVALDESGTYRAVYTVRFRDAIYVLHAFQKKLKKGIATPKQEIELIAHRLASAERDHKERQN
jgi:phage-related protein